MADGTAIEWARHPVTGRGATWNPIRARNRATGRVGTHCEHVTEACRFCYAERGNLNRRNLPFGGTGLAFKPGHIDDIEIFLDEEVLLQPLRWREPRGIFVCSTTDLFGRWVTDEQLDRIFAVMALASRHVFFVLTKRPERMRSYLLDRDSRQRWRKEAVEVTALNMVMAGTARRAAETVWPLPNVWGGTSCCDQADADALLPVLLSTPLARRFASFEPLLGRIYLDCAVEHPSAQRRSWDGFAWPAFVPEKTRAEIEAFWNPEWGRGPGEWMRGALANGQPPIGTVGAYCVPGLKDGLIEGRFIPAWNNIGRVVDAEGRVHVVSAGRWQNRPTLDGAIVGGESGPHARPMHPDDARFLRDQCIAGGIAFHFKQHGEWIGVPDLRNLPGGSGPGFGSYDHCRHDIGFDAVRVGKKAAGRLLDGRTWDGFPMELAP